MTIRESRERWADNGRKAVWAGCGGEPFRYASDGGAYTDSVVDALVAILHFAHSTDTDIQYALRAAQRHFEYETDPNNQDEEV